MRSGGRPPVTEHTYHAALSPANPRRTEAPTPPHSDVGRGGSLGGRGKGKVKENGSVGICSIMHWRGGLQHSSAGGRYFQFHALGCVLIRGKATYQCIKPEYELDPQ